MLLHNSGNSQSHSPQQFRKVTTLS